MLWYHTVPAKCTVGLALKKDLEAKFVLVQKKIQVHECFFYNTYFREHFIVLKFLLIIIHIYGPESGISIHVYMSTNQITVINIPSSLYLMVKGWELLTGFFILLGTKVTALYWITLETSMNLLKTDPMQFFGLYGVLKIIFKADFVSSFYFFYFNSI